jgi:hypothetical protein
MATLRLIDRDEETIIDTGSESVGEYLYKNKLSNYSFYNQYVSQQTKATVDDLFENKDIVGVKCVSDAGSIASQFNDALGSIISPVGALFSPILDLFRGPDTPSFERFGNETSPNNQIGGRSNEPRLGKRIEDIWGTDPKIFPSLMGTYKRFDTNKEEVECSILCVSRGSIAYENVKDGDYSVNSLSTTKINFYNPGVTLGGTPSSVATPTGCDFAPISVRQNTAISAFEMFDQEHEAVIFGRRTTTVENVQQIGSAPYVKITSKTYVGGVYPEYIYTVEITHAQTDWTTLTWQVGDKLALKGFVHAVDGVAQYYNNCTQKESIITNITSGTLYVSVHVDATVVASGTSFWNEAPLNTAFASAYTRFATYESNQYVISLPYPPYFGAPGSIYGETVLIDGDACGIYRPASYQPIVDITYDTGETTATYLLNFVCDQGTSHGGNTVVVETRKQDGTISTQTLSLPADTIGSKRVGYSFELSFPYVGGSTQPITFSCYRQTPTADKLVLREVYKTKPLTSYSDPGVTFIRMERRFNSLYGAGGDMKLSMSATRKLKNVVYNSGNNTWTLDNNTSIVNSRLDYVIANLHLDSFNGRRNPNSLDWLSLNQATNDVETRFGAGACNIGLTFDESNQKYDGELNELLSSVGCTTYQVGSKSYFMFEKPDNISMQFTHRDMDPSSLKLTRMFRRSDNNDGIKLTYKDGATGDSTILYLPNSSITNPKEVTLKSSHSADIADKMLNRFYNKLIYQKSGCSFTATSLGRRAVPGMVVSVVDNTLETKVDGEVLSQSLSSGGKLILTLSQNVPIGVTSIVLSSNAGEPFEYACQYLTDKCVLLYGTQPTFTIYSDWEQNKTRYQLVTGIYKKYIITEMSNGSEGTTDITCINYDDRYYQGD